MIECCLWRCFHLGDGQDGLKESFAFEIRVGLSMDDEGPSTTTVRLERKRISATMRIRAVLHTQIAPSLVSQNLCYLLPSAAFSLREGFVGGGVRQLDC